MSNTNKQRFEVQQLGLDDENNEIDVNIVVKETSEILGSLSIDTGSDISIGYVEESLNDHRVPLRLISDEGKTILQRLVLETDSAGVLRETHAIDLGTIWDGEPDLVVLIGERDAHLDYTPIEHPYSMRPDDVNEPDQD